MCGSGDSHLTGEQVWGVKGPCVVPEPARFGVRQSAGGGAKGGGGGAEARERVGAGGHRGNRDGAVRSPSGARARNRMSRVQFEVVGIAVGVARLLSFNWGTYREKNYCSFEMNT